MTMLKRKRARAKLRETSPARLLESELEKLRLDLRATVRAYAARLEIGLAESRAALESSNPPKLRARSGVARRVSNESRAETQIDAGKGASKIAQDRFPDRRPSGARSGQGERR